VPVPWDVTVSFAEGTAHAPEAMLNASVQLDLYDPDIRDAWKLGIFMQPVDKFLLSDRNEIRPKAATYINFLERGGVVSEHSHMEQVCDEIDQGCRKTNMWVRQKCLDLMGKNKLVGLVGGDHSVPLGYLEALGEKHNNFGILQIDAHHDLRKSYEGFHFSHASIFFNALKINSVSKLVQVGIRDYCDEEVEIVQNEPGRITVFYDQQIKENQFNGLTWKEQCDSIIQELPDEVYISFDIDGLDPKLCPGTGTPVPGGLDFFEINFLLKKLVESGRKIIGFDVCEVGQHVWDANVGARILYKLCNWMGRSHGKI
jgi:agmatinase